MSAVARPSGFRLADAQEGGDLCPHPLCGMLQRECAESGVYSPIVLFTSSMVADATGAFDVSRVQASKAAELDELKSMCTVPLPA